MTKPSSKTTWTSNTPENRTEPGASKKNTGFLSSERPGFQHFNWLIWNHGQWVDFFEDALKIGTNSVIGETGNIGINEINPTCKLTIKSAGTSTSPLLVKGSNGHELLNLYENSFGHAQIEARDANGSVKIELNTNGNSYFIGGKLGIGTDNPLTALHIVSTADQLTVEYDSNRKTLYSHSGVASIFGNVNNNLALSVSGGNTGYGGIDFLTNGLRRAFITKDGNIGIGVDSPQKSLDIANSINVSGTDNEHAGLNTFGARGIIQTHMTAGSLPFMFAYNFFHKPSVGDRFFKAGQKATRISVGNGEIRLGVSNVSASSDDQPMSGFKDIVINDQGNIGIGGDTQPETVIHAKRAGEAMFAKLERDETGVNGLTLGGIVMAGKDNTGSRKEYAAVQTSIENAANKTGRLSFLNRIGESLMETARVWGNRLSSLNYGTLRADQPLAVGASMDVQIGYLEAGIVLVVANGGGNCEAHSYIGLYSVRYNNVMLTEITHHNTWYMFNVTTYSPGHPNYYIRVTGATWGCEWCQVYLFPLKNSSWLGMIG